MGLQRLCRDCGSTVQMDGCLSWAVVLNPDYTSKFPGEFFNAIPGRAPRQGRSGVLGVGPRHQHFSKLYVVMCHFRLTATTLEHSLFMVFSSRRQRRIVHAAGVYPASVSHTLATLIVSEIARDGLVFARCLLFSKPWWYTAYIVLFLFSLHINSMNGKSSFEKWENGGFKKGKLVWHS